MVSLWEFFESEYFGLLVEEELKDFAFGLSFAKKVDSVYGLKWGGVMEHLFETERLWRTGHMVVVGDLVERAAAAHLINCK